MKLPLYLPAKTVYVGVPYLLADSGLAVILRGKHVERGALSAQIDEPGPGHLRVTVTLSICGMDVRLNSIIPPTDRLPGLLQVESKIDHTVPIDVPSKRKKRPRIEYPQVELRLYRVGRVEPTD